MLLGYEMFFRRNVDAKDAGILLWRVINKMKKQLTHVRLEK